MGSTPATSGGTSSSALDGVTPEGTPVEDATAEVGQEPTPGSPTAATAPTPPSGTSPAEPAAEEDEEHRPRHLAEEPEHHPRHRRRNRGWVLPAVLVLLLLAVTGLGLHLWDVARAWERRDAEWHDHATGLAEQLATTRGELEDTVAELEVVRGQLDQAQVRITELADEKARLGDEHAVVRQLADYQERVSQVATTVVAALDACIASQQRLVRWYAEAEDAERRAEEDPGVAQPDPAALAELRGRVDQVCTAAQEAKDELEEALRR